MSTFNIFYKIFSVIKEKTGVEGPRFYKNRGNASLSFGSMGVQTSTEILNLGYIGRSPKRIVL